MLRELRYARTKPISTAIIVLSVAIGLVVLTSAQISHRLMRWYMATEDPEVDKTEYSFARLKYSGGIGNWKYWGTDFPAADVNLMRALQRITKIRTDALAKPIEISDPTLFAHPFIYIVEPEQMDLTDREAGILREYLLRGGFMVVDDFWGSHQWTQFERQIYKVFPEYPIVDIPLSHPLFHCFYDIKQLPLVPAFGGDYEEDGHQPHCRGVFNDRGDLMVVINWNTDLGDGWEWVGQDTRYSEESSIPALMLGVNIIVYAMTH